MANRVSWHPSTDANVINVGHYDIQSAPDVVGSPGSFSDLATVNDVRPGPAYQGGFFFYIDAAGDETTWYQVRAVDSAAQASAYSTPFQAGANATPPSQYTSEALVASVRRRANIPIASVDFTENDILDIANEEMLTNIVPLVSSANEDFLRVKYDYSYDPDQWGYRIPARAIGSKLSTVSFVDASDGEFTIPRVRPGGQEALGFYVQSGYVVPVNRTGVAYPTLRMRFYLRPGTLVATDQAGLVAGFDVDTGEVTLSLTPTGFVVGLSYDLVKGTSPFDTIAFDQTALDFTGLTVTFATPLPDGLAAGDLVCQAGMSNVVQLPAEFFPVLAQATAAACLEQMGDKDGSIAANIRLDKEKKRVLNLVSPRVEGEPGTTVPAPMSPWRRPGGIWR